LVVAGYLGSLGMRAPTYRWICHKCERANEPNTFECAFCCFPADASAIEIAHARGEPNPSPKLQGRPLPRAGNLLKAFVLAPVVPALLLAVDQSFFPSWDPVTAHDHRPLIYSVLAGGQLFINLISYSYFICSLVAGIGLVVLGYFDILRRLTIILTSALAGLLLGFGLNYGEGSLESIITIASVGTLGGFAFSFLAYPPAAMQSYGAPHA